MKFFTSILLLMLLAMSSGCMMTSAAIDRAKGENGPYVYIKKGDKVVVHGRISTLIIEHPQNGEPAEIRFIRTSEEGGAFYDPHPAYYALLPLTIPADIVTTPFQVLCICTVGTVW